MTDISNRQHGRDEPNRYVAVVASLPIPVIDHSRMILQPVADKSGRAMRLAPLDWLPSGAHEAVEHLARENTALRAQLAREREAGDRLVTAIDRVTGKAWASIATMEDAAYLDGTLAAFRAAREGDE